MAKLVMIFWMLAACESHNRPKLPVVGQVFAVMARDFSPRNQPLFSD